jgi:hypothetical protein
VAWAAADRPGSGASRAAAILPIAVGVSALAVTYAAQTRLRAAALWAALAAVGQAAALLLVDAGPRLHYQHYPPLRALAQSHPALLAVLAVQAIAVAIGMARYAQHAGAGRWLSARIAAAIILSICTAATVSPQVATYLAELGFAAAVQLVAIANILVMTMALPSAAVAAASSRLTRWLGADEDRETDARPARDWFGILAAVTTVTLAAVMSVVSYQRHPHVPDEVVYLYHARYFAAGQMTMPAPPVPEAFDVDLMYYEPTRWFSPVPPGWPAVLATGSAAGVPWLVNPVLGGVCVWLTSLLLGDLYPRRVARIATALLAVSPWAICLAMSFMTQTLTLACALMAAVGISRARRRGSVSMAALAGAGVGATSLIRPLDGVIVGALIALWAFGLGGRRLSWGALAGLGAGTALVGALAFPYNAMLTGDPLKFPINLYNDRYHGANSNAYGFGADRGMGWAIDPNPGHGPVDAVINANLNTFGLNTDLFGWSTGSLVFVAWLACCGVWRRADRLMAAVVGAVFTAYFFYYFSGGPDFGARYWFAMIVPLAALTARGIQEMERRAGGRVMVAACVLTAMAVVIFLPWRAMDKYRDFRGMRADIRTLAAERHFGPDLVLVRGERSPDFASAVILNPLDLQSRATIFAWDRDAAVRSATLRAYRDRKVWFVDGPTVTGDGYRVARGPVPAADVLEGGTR